MFEYDPESRGPQLSNEVLNVILGQCITELQALEQFPILRFQVLSQFLFAAKLIKYFLSQI